MRTHKPALFLALLGSVLAFAPAQACNVPVFRYALERWRADAYEVILFHKGPLPPDVQQLVATLRTAGEQVKAPANVDVHAVDLAGEVAEPLRKLWQAQSNASLPWLVVRYPDSARLNVTVWAGSPSKDTVQALLQSPLRRQIAKHLLEGDAVVWLLIESGDPKLDDAAAKLLRTELSRLEGSLKLPNDADKDTVPLLSTVPLRIGFPVLRVARTDPKEQMLVAMLLNTDDEVARMKGVPIMYPIFGRGRSLDAFCGKGINAENIETAATFLCGACSCTVKKLNPGVDVLFTADWDGLLEAKGEAPPEPPSKPGQPVPIPRPSEVQQAIPVAAAAVTPTPAEVPIVQQSTMGRELQLAALAVGLILAVFLSVVLRSRKPGGESPS